MKILEGIPELEIILACKTSEMAHNFFLFRK